MTGTTRRRFLCQGAAAMAAAAYAIDQPLPIHAEPFKHPIGLQLYTLGAELGSDYDGTLARVAAIGYKEVETAHLFDKKPDEIRSSLSRVGLACRSMHIWGPPQTWQQNFERTLHYATILGARYVVSSIVAPARAGYGTQAQPFDFDTITIDDYKSLAEHYNKMGERAKQAGLRFAYHNHSREFRPLQGGKTGYDELLRETAPELVKFELDCGWMEAAGQDPAAYIAKYPDRYRMLHIKDFKLSGTPSFSEKEGAAPAPTELGRGSINYKPILAAAIKSRVECYFVEQEPPFSDMPAIDAIKVDYDYLHSLNIG